LRGRHSTRFYRPRSSAGPVARENPLKALIFLGFVARELATRQNNRITFAPSRQAKNHFHPPMFLVKTAA